MAPPEASSEETINVSPAMLQQIINTAVRAATDAARANSTPSTAKADKPKRPQVSRNSTAEQWSYFITRWNRYKQMTGLGTNVEETVCHLLECCDEDLQLGLHRSLGADLTLKTETEVISEIRKFAVTEQRKLVCRNKLRSMTQDRDEDINHFAARVKGQADMCDYMVTCTKSGCNTKISYAHEEIRDQICMGLVDPDIQQDLLSHKDQAMSLEETISFVATRESGKKCQIELSGRASIGKISQYQKSKLTSEHNQKSPTDQQKSPRADYAADERTCMWCGLTGHGPKARPAERRTRCPAFGKVCQNCTKRGHFKNVCRLQPTSSASISDIGPAEMNSPIFLGGISSNATGNKQDLQVTVGTLEPFPHMEYTQANGWNTARPKDDPILQLKVSICKDAYKTNGLRIPKSTEAVLPAIADSGARTTVASTSLLNSLGIKREDLFPVRQKLCGANDSRLNIIGGVFLNVSDVQKTDSPGVKLLCYIQNDNPGRIYLSRTACETLGIIPKDFPNAHVTAVAQKNTHGRQCKCPEREKPRETPTALPFAATDANRGKLEEWILNHYASSTFNVCEHQQLPMMTGPPLKLILDKDASPKAVHTPIPVPIHWQESVKAGLDRDVKLGVIEPVPWGTPTTWCSRMVVVAKQDGTPRRTVDLQSLNAVSARQTHHTVSPFNQAALVPHNTKKTVCDAWNGYHSVPIREEDRNLTTFITPWGRYRYCTAPQGYLAAGDAYTRRFDEIISELPHKTKCVDDTLMWADTITQSFFQTCNFLDICGNNGITLNPKKFQFARDEVEFAGFTITNHSVRPAQKFLKAIEEFPTPADITGIRSWFGLVNQVSYAFSLTDVMQPFRELLKPGNKFFWDDNLDYLFDSSKRKIISCVQNGVRIFDPNLKTCLFTDWSKTGTGFMLTQKHCTCAHDGIRCCRDGWKVSLAGSKFNNAAESNYAPIEGECLAVVKALHKCRHFVLGCENLVIATDHKPLLKILNERSLDGIHNPRLLNLKEKTLRFRFTLVHVPGKLNTGSDAVSRYPVEKADTGINEKSQCGTVHLQDQLDTESYVLGVAIGSLTSLDGISATTWDKVRQETLNDPDLEALTTAIKNDFRERPDGVPEVIRPFFRFKERLSIVDSVLLYNDRIIIPKCLRPDILQNLHAAHQGVSSMTSRAEQCVFWPSISHDIKTVRDRCDHCNKMAPSNPASPPTALPHPQFPFQMICADYFQYGGNNYLVVVDRYSNWPCVMQAPKGGDSRHLVSSIKAISEIFGIPEELSSDGGPQFTSYTTKSFLKSWGIKHRLSSVAFPHSNTRAELGVKTIKRSLVNNVKSDGSLDSDKFRRALLQYKNTPDKDTKLSPAQIVFGRAIRDFTPSTPAKYRPASVWTMTADLREQALAKRHASQR